MRILNAYTLVVQLMWVDAVFVKSYSIVQLMFYSVGVYVTHHSSLNKHFTCNSHKHHINRSNPNCSVYILHITSYLQLHVHAFIVVLNKLQPCTMTWTTKQRNAGDLRVPLKLLQHQCVGKEPFNQYSIIHAIILEHLQRYNDTNRSVWCTACINNIVPNLSLICNWLSL